MGVGHAVRLCVKTPIRDLRDPTFETQYDSVELLAIPIFDGYAIQSFADIVDVTSKL